MNQHRFSHWHAIVAFVCVLAGPRVAASFAAAVAAEEVRDGERHLVLENEHAKVVVWPDAGAAIVEYIDKRSGNNFATPGVAKGKAGPGMKDMTEVVDNTGRYLAMLPYQTEIKQGEGYAAIVATCVVDHLRVEREMRLADDSTHLTVIVRHTNISDKPQPMNPRFHPYMVLDDKRADNSAILVPGPGPQTMRRIPMGAGWESHYMDVPGYWLAANYKTGVGMWMTYNPDDVALIATWTDYRYNYHPRRGHFVADMLPQPRVIAPGESMMLHCAYQPFITDDKTDDLKLAFVPADGHAGAKRFLDVTRANLEVVSTHTMVPRPNNAWTYEGQNRFYFSHRRRDRFAVRDWGIADAMMDISADQSVPIRLRLFARAYNSFDKWMTVQYRLTVRDGFGATVKQNDWKYTIAPAEHRVVDMRETFSVSDLPDGRYTFTVEAFDDGKMRQAIHEYTETRKLIAVRQAEMVAQRLAEADKSLVAKERPFVTALRTIELPTVQAGVTTVPIGLEEGSGLARQSWPVRLGVPLAQGTLPRGAAAALFDPNGKPVLSQTHIMATWMDGSAKWVQVDFLADIPANGHVFYSLKTNTAPQAAAASDKPVAAVNGNVIAIDTGAAQWTINPADERLLGILDRNDIWWDVAGGKQYRFRMEGEEAGVTVVENGPVRAVVKFVGWYMAEGDAKPMARCEFRAEFYRGKPWYRLYHTFTFAGDPWKDMLDGTGVRFTGLLSKATGAGVEVDGASVAHGQSITLRQADENNALISSGKTSLHTGRRAGGAAMLKAEQGGAVVYHRNLWQMFPKTVNIDVAKAMIAFDYWPKTGKPMDWRPREDGWIPSSSSPQSLAIGVSRTHEFIIDPTGAFDPTRYQPLFDEPIVAVTPPRHLTATGALLHLQPYNPDKVPQLEAHLSDAIDSYLLNQELHSWYGQWHYGTLPNMFLEEQSRWADFGRYANILNEQDICHTHWLLFLRSGDRKYLRLAEANTRHLMEVGTIRLNPVIPNGVGMSRRHHECIWLGDADYGHSMLDPFAELYHATGYLPAWEAAERMAIAMANQFTSSWRYISNPVAGLSRMYLDTQNPFYKQHADRIWTDLCNPDRNTWFVGDHGGRMAMYYSQLNADCDRIFKQMVIAEGKERALVYLDSLAMLYAQTGDLRYARMGLKEFEGYLRDSQRGDRNRENPTRWGIAMATQHILAAMRQMVYASDMLDAAIKAPAEETPAAPKK